MISIFMIKYRGHYKSQMCKLIIELIRHHDGTKLKKLQNRKFQKISFSAARFVELKQRTTTERLFFGRDTSWSDLANVARYYINKL